jgi:hypothetical protein
MPLDQQTREKILHRLDQERRELARSGEAIDVLERVTRWRSVDGSHHAVSFSALDERSADAAIEEQIGYYRGIGAEFEWKLYAHDRPRDLLERLRRHGLEIGEREAVLVYELSAGTEWMERAEDCEVVRLEREEQIADYRRVAESVFRKDYAFTAKELADALRAGSNEHRGYIAYVEGQPASIGRLYTHSQSWFAGLYGGGTIESFRGRGLYRAVIAARARDAIAAGAKYLTVDALPTSRPILERMGFQWLTDTWPCTWKPGTGG